MIEDPTDPPPGASPEDDDAELWAQLMAAEADGHFEALEPLDDVPAPPPPPLTGGQVALRLGAVATVLVFLGSMLTGAWPVALGAMGLGGGLMFAWMGHEPAAHARLGRRVRRRIGARLIERGFAAVDGRTWKRDTLRAEWLRFVDPHAASRAPAALAGKVPIPASSLAFTAPLGPDFAADAVLTPAHDRTGLGVEWADHLVATGDGAFDARFTLGGPARPLLALLDGALRDRLRALDDAGCGVDLRDGALRLTYPCVDDPTPGLEDVAELLNEIRARLAEPIDVRLRRQLEAARADGPTLHRLLPCLEDLEHDAVVALVHALAPRWPWLAVVRATRAGGDALGEALRTALVAQPDAPPWGLLEPALARLLSDGAPLPEALGAVWAALHQPLVRFMLEHRPAGDALIARLLLAPGALFGYLDDGGDVAVVSLLVAAHDADDGAVERALRDVATHQLDRIALPAITALGEVGDGRTAAWLDGLHNDGLRARVIARQDAVAAAVKAIRHRERRAKDALHAELGGGLAVSDQRDLDGRLSPAAGGELSPADDAEGVRR